MSLEKVFLVLFILGICIYAGMIAFASISVWPWGILGLLGLAFGAWVAWRLYNDQVNNDEDKYYEDNFDT